MIYIPVALKLHAYGLSCLQDPNWTGMNLFDYVKQHTRRRKKPVELLRKPLEVGLLFYLGSWLYDEYLSIEHFETLEGEYHAWYLEDAIEFVHFHVPKSKQTSIEETKDLLQKLSDEYEHSEEKYFSSLVHLKSEGIMLARYESLYQDFESTFEDVRHDYARNYADRVLHDRQLCANISQLLLVIGFDGDDDEKGVPKAWVEREPWPERVSDYDCGISEQVGPNVRRLPFICINDQATSNRQYSM